MQQIKFSSNIYYRSKKMISHDTAQWKWCHMTHLSIIPCISNPESLVS